MADVRALLRSEQQTRRLTHPDLAYTKSGVPLCKVCGISIKTEIFWEKHQRSSLHLKSKSAAKSGSEQSLPVDNEGRKRKADDDHARFNTVERKKKKASSRSPSPKPSPEQIEEGADSGAAQALESQPSNHEPKYVPSNFFDAPQSTNPAVQHSSNVAQVSSEQVKSVDEAEWAAFEKEIKTESKTNAVDYSQATISAPAMTAAEIQARSTEEEALRRKDIREAQIEDEKEDAARQMEEEFDAMEAYESRAKKLRDAREMLRKTAATASSETKATSAQSTGHPPPEIPGGVAGKAQDSADDENEEEEGNDWDEWRFGSTD